MLRRPSTTPGRRTIQGVATLATAAVLGLAAAPAYAATPIAQASGTGLRLTVVAVDTDSGTFTAQTDGVKETTSGNNMPPISLLTGQSFIEAGTLAQDAATKVENRNGLSFGCAGLAGEGAAVAAVEDGTCLTPGQNLTLNAANLDLSNLQISRSMVLSGLDTQTQAALQPVLDAVVPALQGGLQTALTSLGDPGVFLDLGAIQSNCMATPTTATGDANLTNVEAYAEVGGMRVDLASFPTNPEPNTKVVTGLDQVATVIEDAIKSQLTTALDGALGPLAGAVDQAAVINGVLGQISDQLAPLEENVLDGTLNKQVKGDRSIDVTALDLNILPAASDFGVEGIHAQIGQSVCGPNARVAAPAPDPTPTPTPTPPPAVPTSVPAGVDDAASGTADPLSPLGAAALGGLVVLAAGAGVASYRRSLR